ncbi:MAG: hypothetical protein Hals2KO_21960 [Halioglobus sp.]
MHMKIAKKRLAQRFADGTGLALFRVIHGARRLAKYDQTQRNQQSARARQQWPRAIESRRHNALPEVEP